MRRALGGALTFTHDGGPNTTFPPGAEVVIPFGDYDNQNTGLKTWTWNAVLGTDMVIMITMTKQPC